jgi:uncharacterized cupin superfamily protein
VSDYTVMRAADAPDYTGDAPGAFLGYARPMGSEQLGVNVRVLEPGMAHVPPGDDPSLGHSHRTIEEIYFVLEGELTVKLGDDVLALGPRDAVRIPAQTPRATRNDSAARTAFMLISVKVEDIRAESIRHDSFWV